MSDPYDYKFLEENLKQKLPILEGRVVNSIKAQLAGVEINQLILDTDKGCIAIIPHIGGEVLVLSECDMPETTQELLLIEVLTEFRNKRIVQARMIGEAWNGHGVEIGFEKLATQTILVSSVECSENNTKVSDALRIGVGSYEIEFQFDT
jgi:hypothetical protein